MPCGNQVAYEMPDHRTRIADAAPESITRRKLVEAFGAAGLGGVLAGCTSAPEGGESTDGGGSTDTTTRESTTPPETVSLEVAFRTSSQAETSAVKNLTSQFSDSQERIDVEATVVQSKYLQKLKTQLSAGEAPDVFYLGAQPFGQFASQGTLLNLDPLRNADGYDFDDFYDPLVSAYEHQGSLYGIPKDFSTLGMFHNTKMFEQAGASVPETWDELRTALGKVKSNTDVEAPMIEYPNARSWKGLIYQNGGQILSDDGSEVVFASDAGVEALDFLVQLKKDGLLVLPSEISAGWHGKALGTEQVATAILGPWGLPFLADKFPKVNEKVDIAHIPKPSDGQKATPAYTVSWTGSASTKSEAASRELIKSYTSKEGMELWAQEGIALTARKSLADADFYKNNPRWNTLLEAAEWSKPVAYGSNTQSILNKLHPQLTAAMKGKKSPRDALKTAQQDINSSVMTE